MIWEVPERTPVEFADDAKLRGPGDTPEGKGCHPAGPRPAGGVGWQEPYEVQKGRTQSPARGKEETPTAIQAGDLERSLWVLRSQADREPAAHSGSKGGQHHPGLYEQQLSYEKEVIILLLSALVRPLLDTGSSFGTPPESESC